MLIRRSSFEMPFRLDDCVFFTPGRSRDLFPWVRVEAAEVILLRLRMDIGLWVMLMDLFALAIGGASVSDLFVFDCFLSIYLFHNTAMFAKMS